jgi:hypothetical protein
MSAPTMAGRWQNGLCSDVCGGDCGTCVRYLPSFSVRIQQVLIPSQCAAWCCAPFLYSRAAQRLDFYPHNNPAEIQTFDKHCFMFACAGSLYMEWLPMAFKREEMRARLGIEGDMCQDILVSPDKLVNRLLALLFEVLTGMTQVSVFCKPCSLAQMNSEMESRAAQEQLLKPIGYQPQTQRMVYQPPNQQPQLQLQPPVQPQPQVQEKKSTPQGV